MDIIQYLAKLARILRESSPQALISVAPFVRCFNALRGTVFPNWNQWCSMVLALTRKLLPSSLYERLAFSPGSRLALEPIRFGVGACSRIGGNDPGRPHFGAGLFRRIGSH